MKYAIGAVILTVWLAGCDKASVGEPPVTPVAIAPTQLYAGGAVTIKSPRFVNRQDSVYADTVLLARLHQAGDSIVFRIPGAARGPYSLRLNSPTGIALGEIQVAGFAAFRPVSGQMGYYTAVWPGVEAAIVGGSGGNVVLLTPKTGTIRTLLPGAFNLGDGGTRTPGPTPDPNVFLLQSANGYVQAWRMQPQPQLIRDFPTYNHRHFAQFSDSVFFRGLHHFVETLRFRNGRFEQTPIYQGTYEETHEVILSPTRDRATLRVNGSLTGPPVFNMVTGDTAYHVRQLFRSYGAAFSENGDTLWMIGVQPDRKTTMLVMLNARTGVELARKTFPGRDLTAMRRDPDGRIFIATGQWTGNVLDNGEYDLNLLVVSDRSLALLGNVDVPKSHQCMDFCDVILAVGSDGVFAVQYNEIFEFDYIRR